MKTIFLFLLLTVCCSFSTALAQKVIAVQSGGQMTTYNTFEDAIAAANNGDDIYLPGGIVPKNIPGNPIYITKKLNIIGVGYNNNETPATGKTVLQGVLTFSAGSSGSSITGVELNSELGIHTVNNILIKRVRMGYVMIYGTVNNILISESVSGALAGQTNYVQSNIVVEKCFIGDFGGTALDHLNNFYLKNSIIFNYSSTPFFFRDVNSSLIENTIIATSAYIPITQGYNNQFNNCLFTQSINGLGPNTQSNCIFDQPLVDIFIQHTGNTFSIDNDYHLQPNSPGINAGTDGTDIGLYGTSEPFKDGGTPTYPHILSKTIGNTTDPNGNLLINIQVKAQDH